MSEKDVEKAEMEELGLTTASGGSIFVTGKIAGALITLAMLIFLARYLQPKEYGIYTIAIAFSTFLSIGGGFGFGTAVRKMIPEQKTKAGIGSVVASSLAMSGLLSVVITVFGIGISSVAAVYMYNDPALALPLMAACITIFLSVMINLCIAILVGMGMNGKATKVVLLYSLIELVAVAALVLLGYGVFGAIIGTVIGFAVSFVVMLYMVMAPVGMRAMKVSRPVIKRLAKFSAPIVVSNIAQTGVINFGIAFLGAFATASIVGNFGTAFNLGGFVEVFLTSSTFVLLPVFARAFENQKLAKRMQSIYNNSVYYSLMFLLPLIAFSAADAKPLVNLLFSKSYSLAPQYFAFIVIGAAVGIIGSYAGTLIIGYGDTKRFMKYQITGVLVQISLVLLLVPFFKAVGLLAALFAATPIILDLIYVKALRGQFSIKLDYARIARVTISAVILGGVLFAVAAIFADHLYVILINLAVLFAIYPPILVYTKTVTNKQIEFIEKIGQRMRPVKWFFDGIVGYARIFMSF